MMNPVTGWFEIIQYGNKRVIWIANLVKTVWLTRYPRPIEIMYEKGSELIDHECINPELKYNMG